MWFIIALVVGGLVGGLILWLRSRNASLTWYEWVIGIAGLLLLLFCVQNFFASQTEGESQAASMFLLITGLPGLILLVITWQLAARRMRTS